VASVNNPSDTGGRLIAASKVSGTSVHNADGEKLGSVRKLSVITDHEWVG
jgi:hypothetical protein